MHRLIPLLLLLLGLALVAPAHAENSWWQAEWKYRKPITVDAGPQGAALGGTAGRMPVLVRLHTGNFAFDGVTEGGKDLRFVAADGRSVLNHQVEQFDPALGIALVWVDVPAVAGDAPQTIWMYYGNANAPAAGSDQRTFDPDYLAVHHFLGGAAGSQDTTAYGNHLAGALQPAAAALIGAGAQLGAEPLRLPGSASMALPAEAAMTVSMWVKPEQLGAMQALYARREGEHALLLGVDNGVPFVQLDQARSAAVAPLVAGQWAHVAMTAGEGVLRLYVAGREVAQAQGALPAFNGDALVGGDAVADATAAVTVPAAQPFQGAIDELRVSKIARSPVQLLADASSQGGDARLLSFGEDEQSAGT
ncbi:TPA: DUF2341 domain-containing protein, partial [Stenotrophomonas maltophilia]|nr:DUF2341 domain-containing protein [Stenotrophomonas maltophilia]HDS1044753.1 DUF2341 domain-containing protein [Stenotrophomonas maltophilia]